MHVKQPRHALTLLPHGLVTSDELCQVYLIAKVGWVFRGKLEKSRRPGREGDIGGPAGGPTKAPTWAHLAQSFTRNRLRGPVEKVRLGSLSVLVLCFSVFFYLYFYSSFIFHFFSVMSGLWPKIIFGQGSGVFCWGTRLLPRPVCSAANVLAPKASWRQKVVSFLWFFFDSFSLQSLFS